MLKSIVLIENCSLTLIFDSGGLLMLVSGLGVTGGSHRLWAHRSYKANFPLRLLFGLCHTISYQVQPQFRVKLKFILLFKLQKFVFNIQTAKHSRLEFWTSDSSQVQWNWCRSLQRQTRILFLSRRLDVDGATSRNCPTWKDCRFERPHSRSNHRLPAQVLIKSIWIYNV